MSEQEDHSSRKARSMPIPRWLLIILAPLALLLVLTMQKSTTITMLYGGSETTSSLARESVAFDYMMGEGAPPQMVMPSSSSSSRVRRKNKLINIQIQASSSGDDQSAVTNNEIADETTYNENENEVEVNEKRPTIRLQDVQLDDDEFLSDIRPRKKPRGVRWKGWSSNNAATTASTPKPRTSGNEWWRKSNLCFEVDYICHGRGKNEWFYYSPQSNTATITDDEASSAANLLLFQPTMELKSAPAKYDGGKDRGETRISIKVDSSSTLQPGDIKWDDGNKRQFTWQSSTKETTETSTTSTCQISATPTHIVLQSLFNDMIGEFYARTLLRLYKFMNDESNKQSRSNDKQTQPWEEDVQFYVHIPYGNKQMLDGHKLLLSGMLSDPNSPPAKSLVDLFINQYEETKDESNASANKEGDCQCYEKMVFCGYDVYTHPSDVMSKDLPLANSKDEDDDASTAATTNDNAGTTSTFDYSLKHTLWSAGKLDKSFELDTGSCGRSSGTRGTAYECKEWYGLRNFLSSNFPKHFPMLEQDIVLRRREQLLQRKIVDETYTGDTREYTFVGLTQRTYRRAWINLNEIRKKCGVTFEKSKRVLCVEVNVENTSSPYEQLLLHRSLDVMIGVHGAQLTQAILLPQHGHVLELLPWITDYIRGKWVQTKHGPTPLGVIFHNTDLNHVGFSLNRTSVPLCLDAVGEEDEKNCFLKQRKKFIWENRDFLVDSDAILQYIEKVVVFARDKLRSCEEMVGQLDDRFVMYNIWCSKQKYWFPSLLPGGLKACIHGSNYPIDPTKEHSLASKMLFDNKKDCCDEFNLECKDAGTMVDGESSASLELALFHKYHEMPKERAEELRAFDSNLKKNRGKARKTGRYQELFPPAQDQ